MDNSISVSLALLILGLSALATRAQSNAPNLRDVLLNSEFEYDARPHVFAPDKRIYTSEYKRLPVYDFGLGKRTDPYSFGLGKRTGFVDVDEDSEEYGEYPYNEEEDDGGGAIPEVELYGDDDMQSVDKRQKSYDFGLGKRFQRYDFGLGKRGNRYDFGLGKRSIGNRDKAYYSFGFGKRNRLYSFGLGKRPSSIASRFNFGLGKRSNVSKNSIAKREVKDHTSTEPTHSTAESGRLDDNDNNNNDHHHRDRNNYAQNAESHSSDEAVLSKRSPLGIPRPNVAFLRQFRKPLYNFGLGKRTTSPNHFASDERNPLIK